jgi:hypothetical protein
VADGDPLILAQRWHMPAHGTKPEFTRQYF